jgi:NAD(P)-dependent dehydrogenase (short-subunit alcohol dehydrogenase family)
VSVVVITGAARGMGRACVDRLRDETDHLLAVDLETPDIEGVEGIACEGLRALGRDQ